MSWRIFLFALLLCGCSSSPTPQVRPEPETASPQKVSPHAPTPTGQESQTHPNRWIEVLLTEQKVLLHEGDETVGEYLVSAGVGTSPGTTTFPGEFIVETMYTGPEETVPGVFVKDMIIFDWKHGNGFHSLPMDKDGNILDPTLGKPASAGCIRLAESKELYDFAEIGMKVLIH